MTSASASVLGVVLALIARTRADFVCTGTQLERRVCLPTGYTKTELPTDNVEVRNKAMLKSCNCFINTRETRTIYLETTVYRWM